jgi:hypothetical protein
MNGQARSIVAVLLTGIWVNASEFFRNEILLKHYWVDHYRSLGLTFPSEPKNGMLWVAWGFMFSLAVYFISRRFDLVQTALLGWFTGFVLMWVVILNLSVLPVALLAYAIPLSLLEAFIAAFICVKISPQG